jgi:hypothetical protein
VVETGGGGTPILLVLAPFLIFGLGAVFVIMALRNERGPKDSGRTFMARANHPLRHVQVALNAERMTARHKAREAAREKAGETGEAGEAGEAPTKPQPPKPTRRPNWLRRVS